MGSFLITEDISHKYLYYNRVLPRSIPSAVFLDSRHKGGLLVWLSKAIYLVRVARFSVCVVQGNTSFVDVLNIQFLQTAGSSMGHEGSSSLSRNFDVHI